MKKLSSLIQLAIFVLIGLLVVGAVAVLVKYTSGGTTELATFFVKVNGNEVLTDTVIGLKKGKESTFEPTYLADKFLTQVKKDDYKYKGYKVEIKPNITDETKFTYSVGDRNYKFESLANKDFCSAFGLNKQETKFTLKVDNFSIAEFISSKHEGKEVFIVPETIKSDKVYFNLIISSFDEKSKITLGLTEDLTVTFTIDGKPYTVKKGVTLETWAEQEDCPLDIKSNQISFEGKNYYLFYGEKSGSRVPSTAELVDEYEYYAVKALLKFIVNDTEYYSPQNTTWESWINGAYAEGNFKIVDDTVVLSENGVNKVLYYNDKPVLATDLVATLSEKAYKVN